MVPTEFAALSETGLLKEMPSSLTNNSHSPEVGL